MEFLVGIIILIFNAIAVIDVIKGSLPTEKKILWVALIVLVPLLGLALYYLVGKPGK